MRILLTLVRICSSIRGTMKYRGLPAIAAVLGLTVLVAAQDEQPRPQKLKVSSGVAERMKVHADPPKYPREAREKGIQGDVIVRATIDTKGHISEVEVVSGDPMLADAALKALKHWKYLPYVLNGQPVEVETTIRFQFHS